MTKPTSVKPMARANKADGDGDAGRMARELKSEQQDTPESPEPVEPNAKVRKGQGPTAMQPLRRPPDDASPEVWDAYRKERKRRKVVKAERRGRIARREQPHDPTSCILCSQVQKREVEIDAQEVADRALLSRNHVYRVLSPGVKDRRGLRTFATLRRLAHDGMGVSLDELAVLVLD